MVRDEFSIGCRAENQWECENPLENVVFLREEYEKYWSKVKKGDNFAFARYADGEYALMLGHAVRAQEGWHAGNEVTLLGKRLLETLTPPREGMVYGISCPCCDSKAYYWYLDHISNAGISFSNLWVNGNFPKFMKDFSALERDAVLITNYVGQGKSYGNLRIKKHYTVSDNCVEFYENGCQDLIERIASEMSAEKNILYVVSAGPLSGIIIWELFRRNPDNCYIDFGSALDLFTHGRVTRPYMLEKNTLSHKDCWMFKSELLRTDVDVVLTAYKRPEVLAQQLDAVLAQTLRPKRVLLYQDGIDSCYSIRFSEEILRKFDDYFVSNTNGGVWKRFSYALSAAKSKYVCVFDDDTIPGQRWLENCHMNMMQHRGVYGTNGILLQNLEYPYGGGGVHIGWHVPNEETAEVDFVGHSWFLETIWLEWMMAKEYKNHYKYVGEDMCLSFSCIEHRIKTFVPAHPVKSQALWGSIPKYGNTYGGHSVAVSGAGDNVSAMNDALQRYHQDGWRPIFEEDKGYLEKMQFQAMRGWYLKNPIIEADAQIEAQILASMEQFREAMKQNNISAMAYTLLAAKSIIILSGLQKHKDRTEFLRYFLQVFLLGVLCAIQQGKHSLSLTYLTSIEEVFLVLRQQEPNELLFYKGLVYYFRQEYVAAERFFVAYLGYFPRDEEALFFAGNAAMMQNDLKRATEAYTHALSIKANYREVSDTIDNIMAMSEQGLNVSFRGALLEDFRKYSLSMERKNIFELPVFICVGEEISKLDNLLDWLLESGYRNIYILDKASVRSSREEFYSRFVDFQSVHILYLKRDLGKDALWVSGILNILHIQTPYVYAEVDGIPSSSCPKNVVGILLEILRQFPFLTKVGLGGNTDSVVEGASGERQDLQESGVPINKNVYYGTIQSKFVLYRNCYHNDNFYAAWTGGNLRTV